MEGSIRIKQIEIVHLNLSYSDIRIHNPRATTRMSDALATHGQIMPILVVAQERQSYTLIDGYLRVAAARRLGKDTLLAHIFDGDEKQALCHVLVRSGERKWDIIEQAGLIHQLHRRHELSQHQIARLVGKAQSWVSRRLALLEALPEQVIECVKQGSISSWAAARVLAPMARANTDHAKQLTEALIKQPLSTRQLFVFFKHYQHSNRKVRENMIKEPQLFVKATEAGQDLHEARQLAQGPEGQWRKDLSVMCHMIQKLIRAADDVIYAGQSNLDQRSLLTAFNKADRMWDELKTNIERRAHDIGCQQRDDLVAAQSRSRYPSDQSTAQHLS
jgi:ParB family chromosome partitioning protein